MTVTPEMIEAGQGAWQDYKGFSDKEVLTAIYTRMSQASPPPLDDEVERAAELISNYVAWRRWDNMAEDKADLRLKMRGGDYDVNEPTKSDCREAARAALSSCRIGTDGEALSLHKADRHDD